YYYFPSKKEILDALIERSYEKPLLTAKNLAAQTEVSPFMRMAMLFQACQNSSTAFIKQNDTSSDNASAQDLAFLHHKYLSHVVSELKPDLTEIIKQGIESGEIHFEYPAALAEIVLIIIAVKLDNSLIPSTDKETEETLRGLISLLEKGTGVVPGTLSYLSLTPYINKPSL
ncbi:MAG: TetR/AcrR family transcriptional regulator, partial [Lachnospiraceae bacterium]|nr:TetR/AcrR family transcriptional regulator [Lachnospiraceae bacterium]